mmetsp:Transcript_34012/g.62656  ORF Transcript_34012/g.62656 Transcript_34012/m.62656 type:complete len:284 (+) Transcript_34012:355-1206(+)
MRRRRRRGGRRYRQRGGIRGGSVRGRGGLRLGRGRRERAGGGGRGNANLVVEEAQHRKRLRLPGQEPTERVRDAHPPLETLRQLPRAVFERRIAPERHLPRGHLRQPAAHAVHRDAVQLHPLPKQQRPTGEAAPRDRHAPAVRQVQDRRGSDVVRPHHPEPVLGRLEQGRSRHRPHALAAEHGGDEEGLRGAVRRGGRVDEPVDGTGFHRAVDEHQDGRRDVGALGAQSQHSECGEEDRVRFAGDDRTLVADVGERGDGAGGDSVQSVADAFGYGVVAMGELM